MHVTYMTVKQTYSLAVNATDAICSTEVVHVKATTEPIVLI